MLRNIDQNAAKQRQPFCNTASKLREDHVGTAFHKHTALDIRGQRPLTPFSDAKLINLDHG